MAETVPEGNCRWASTQSHTNGVPPRSDMPLGVSLSRTESSTICHSSSCDRQARSWGQACLALDCCCWSIRWRRAVPICQSQVVSRGESGLKAHDRVDGEVLIGSIVSEGFLGENRFTNLHDPERPDGPSVKPHPAKPHWQNRNSWYGLACPHQGVSPNIGQGRLADQHEREKFHDVADARMHKGGWPVPDTTEAIGIVSQRPLVILNASVVDHRGDFTTRKLEHVVREIGLVEQFAGLRLGNGACHRSGNGIRHGFCP